jgi:purine-nucleoside phosphorylase
MKNYPTPHIDATPDDFAKTVLMPGDPLRAKFIAENFLENKDKLDGIDKENTVGSWRVNIPYSEYTKQ